jgi:nitrogen fixation protein FixH
MREIRGHHVLLGFVGAFGVIIGANLTLAYNAVSTFPGLEVKNSYEASQVFDRNKEAQLSLGWTVAAEVADGELRVTINDAEGRPVNPPELTGIFGKATHVKADVTPEFVYQGGVHVARVPATPGNWNLRMKAVAEDGTIFQQRIPLYVPS